MSSAAAAAAAPVPSGQSAGAWARIRLADRRDVPHIRRLSWLLLDYHQFAHHYAATEASLTATLFPSPSPPPFCSYTVLMLESSPSPFPYSSSSDDGDSLFSPIVRRIELPAPVEDPEAAEFASPRNVGGKGQQIVVAGFLLCYPNYEVILGRQGLHMEGLFVRAAWRRMGLGQMLLAAVAGQAARMGMGLVDWRVIDWNANAIKFYEKMGAEVMHSLRICLLAGDKLAAYAAATGSDGGNANEAS